MHASKSPSSSDDKSAKLPALLERLLHEATRELNASAPQTEAAPVV